MSYQLLATFAISEFSEFRLERQGRRYLIARINRAYARHPSGTDRREARISKGEALEWAAMESLPPEAKRLLEAPDPARTAAAKARTAAARAARALPEGWETRRGVALTASTAALEWALSGTNKARRAGEIIEAAYRASRTAPLKPSEDGNEFDTLVGAGG